MTTNRPVYFVIFWILALADLPAEIASEKETPQRPNVILILTDDQGYGPMGCHGDANIHTPEMDRLHGESVRFTNFHVQPNCAPTRAMLMTGRPPMKNGVWATIRGRSLLRRGESTVADSFKAGGYRTALFGKWHLGDSCPFRPQDRGFEEVLVHGGGGVGNIQDYWANNYFDDHYLHNGKWEKFDGYCTDVWFEEAENFIQKHRSQPFFVMISTNAPHLPLVAPQRDLDLYRDQKAVQAKPGIAEFYAMISNIDTNLGQLRKKLKEWHLEKNTILVFMSDNGTTKHFATWNDGMSGGKGSTLEGGHRVPFFIHWPGGGLAEGRDIAALTTGMDLRPTLEKLCGLKQAPGPPADGKSLVPLLQGNTPAWIDRTICLDLQRQQRVPQKNNPHTVMQGTWRWTDGKLHNLENDPAQQRDVKSAHPERAQRMQQQYDRWWQQMSAHDPAAGHEILIGSELENPCLLTTHDISGAVAWNHDQALAGVRTTGFWEIEVARDGEYEFALRRYPVEAGAPIRGTIPVPEKLRKFHYFCRGYDYAVSHERSQALPVATASMTIGAFHEKKSLPKNTTASPDYEVNKRGEVLAVKFTAVLKAGMHQLKASFADQDGSHLTAPYYVRVTRK